MAEVASLRVGVVVEERWFGWREGRVFREEVWGAGKRGGYMDKQILFLGFGIGG